MSQLRILPLEECLGEPLRRPLVAVHPAEQFASRRRVLGAIAEIADIEFVPADMAPAKPDAVIRFAGGVRLSIDLDPGFPVFEFCGHSTEALNGGTTLVRFTASPFLDRALRGGTLVSTAAALEVDQLAAGRPDVLASAEGVPTWWRSDDLEFVASALPELRPGESLRQRLRTDPLPICALISFLRRAIPRSWTAPDLYAAFLFDDPNLHGASYGYIDYRELLPHAAEHGYHVAFATIPLDMWFASRRGVQLFRENPGLLSLLMHGNDHVRRELGRSISAAEHRRTLAQGLRRVRRFEARHKLHVDRVMAPPHGACSSDAATQLLLLGYQALCVSRPYPWLAAAPADDPVLGCRPAENVVGGLPVIGRVPFSAATTAELTLRAFLHQPVVVYGHHGDVREGLDVLAAGAEAIERIGSPNWRSIGSIASGLYETRSSGLRLDVRLWTRSARVVVPEGVEEVGVRVGFTLGATDQLVANLGSGARGGRTICVNVKRRDAVDPESVDMPRPNVWSVPRRTLTEMRDRGSALARNREKRRYAP